MVEFPGHAVFANRVHVGKYSTAEKKKLDHVSIQIIYHEDQFDQLLGFL